MLFGYPMAATDENWLHECLCAMLQTIHTSLDTGVKPPAWPDIIPVIHRPQLRSHRGLRDRLATYRATVAGLNKEERARIIQALNDQNDIPALLSCVHDCATLDELPVSTRAPIECLFVFAFKLLTDLGIRDRQYAVIYRQTRYHVCPFCGCEYLGAPGASREALDHYLVRTKYPLAATNLRNLPPMGKTCNSGYKLSKDILRRDDGKRRRSFDPYNAPDLSVSLYGSQPNDGLDGPLISDWQIEFPRHGEKTDTWDEEADTWDSVFAIRERYKRDILSTSFSDWLWEFRNWCRSAHLTDTEDEHVIDAIDRYEGYLSACGLNDRAFLKAAVFRMLLRYCREGQRRILDVMRDLVIA